MGIATTAITLTDSLTGVQYQLGAGYVTDVVPTFLYTYNQKVYALAAATAYFCAINDPSTWNNVNGNFNGFVLMSNYYATATNLVAVSQYQGRLAFFSQYAIQFMIIDPDPTKWQQVQVLTNIGTIAPLSVASLGDLDVMFLFFTGIRSLRVRDTTLNAYVNDIGSAIDQLIQPVIAANTLTTIGKACGKQDPITGRYWLFIPDITNANGGVIYVLSYYPSSKIEAWTTYDTSFYVNGVLSYFTPMKFVFYNGQLYASAVDGQVYQFGGASGVVYDATTATVQIPYFDMKEPGSIKLAKNFDCDITGTWTIAGTGDWITASPGNLNTILTNQNGPTFDQGFIPFSAQGTHFTLQFTSTDSSAAQLTTTILHYTHAEEPAQ